LGDVSETEDEMIKAKTLALVGQRFGKLTLLSLFQTTVTPRKTLAICLCECGQKRNVWVANLKSSNTRSCGCYQRESTTTHGQSGAIKTQVYTAWDNMRKRCSNPRRKDYHNYGGRGITVCERWNSFELFFADMGNPPSKEHSLDRIDNNGPYCPENVRWATKSQQMNNRSDSRYLTHDGTTATAAEWSRIIKLTSQVIRKRLRLGWSTAEALTTAVHEKRKP